MLINFRFSNCRSFYDEALFSLEATADREYEGLNTFSVDSRLTGAGNERLLRSALIFGGNASGKSNLLKALDYMRSCVLFSGSREDIKNNEPFALLDGASEKNSLYEAEFIENGRFYDYGFNIEKGRIRKEWLRVRTSEKKLTDVFVREDSSFYLVGEKAASRMINPLETTLFISVAGNFKLDMYRAYFDDVMAWFKKLTIVFTHSDNMVSVYGEEDGKYHDMALDILSRSDIGINDFKLVSDPLKRLGGSFDFGSLSKKGQLKEEEGDWVNLDLETDFNVYDEEGRKTGEKRVRLFRDDGFNSEGTERLLLYLGYILKALDKGLVILVDEIDARLHFLVVDYIVSRFNSITWNPNDAQLIATAHNVLLMDGDIRRDQIYFTSKDKRGRSYLASLSDYKDVRKNALYSKKYLAGFYVDLPNMRRDD